MSEKWACLLPKPLANLIDNKSKKKIIKKSLQLKNEGKCQN